MTTASTMRVHHAAALADPAVGVHFRVGARVGLIPEPRGAGDGRCWACRRDRIGRVPPLCDECARDVFEVFAVGIPESGPTRRAG